MTSSSMKIEGIRALSGPNIYSYRPVLVMRLNLGVLYERETREMPYFNESLLKLLPGLKTHHCSLGKPEGFLTRLDEGTFFGHVIEHIALELMDLAGIGTTHGKTRQAEGSDYIVVVEYRAEAASAYLLKEAVELVDSTLRQQPFDVEAVIREATRLVAEKEPGPTTRAIMEAAESRGIPYRREGTRSLVQLGYGKHRRYIQAAMTDQTSSIGVELAQDKSETKDRLRQNGIPVPAGKVVHSLDEAIQAADEMAKPVVVKPLTGQKGRGVSTEVTSRADMIVAFKGAQQFSEAVLIEEKFCGRNYRVLTINGRMIAASERLPCRVIGDGVSTIDQLITQENKNPLRGNGHERPLTKIQVDSDVKKHLENEGLSLGSIPALNQSVTLSNRTNLSTGATARDVTDEIHPSIVRMCERAARLVGLDICGVDLVLPDIALPFTTGGIIEVNASPGLRMHQYPSEGKARDVGGAVVDAIYPNGKPSRIPIVSVTGTNGKTTVTRLIGHVMSKTGVCVGMTTTDGIYIGGDRVVDGDTTGPLSARTVLSDPAVELAILETARGGILRRGLGYDWSDIAVLTNIGNDHVGQDGIKSVEDVLFIKSLVAERVRKGGTLILNADDEHLVRLKDCERIGRIPKNFVYFSLYPDNRIVRNHLKLGGTAYFSTGKALVEASGTNEDIVAELDKLPIMMNGAADFQAANLLAAIAACRASHVSREMLAETLPTFSSCMNNPGRANLYRLNGGHVMVDYGHNSQAFDAICRMAAHWKDSPVTGIIGVPGDRDDALIAQAGRVAAKGFNKLIVREDRDRRGRREGDVAKLLCQGVREVAPAIECEVVLDEMEALRKAISRMAKGELIVLFYENLRPVEKALAEFSAEPVVRLPW